MIDPRIRYANEPGMRTSSSVCQQTKLHEEDVLVGET